MTFEAGHEVYVVFEGVFALHSRVDATRSDWVTVRTASGARVELPIEAVVEWDVETPLRTGIGGEGLANRSAPAVTTPGCEVSASPPRLLRRA